MVHGKRSNTGEGTLSPTMMDDGKWHFIGMIKEANLHRLSVEGFSSYQRALDVMEAYGYTLFIA